MDYLLTFSVMVLGEVLLRMGGRQCLYHLYTLPSTILHETAHFLVALILGGRPSFPRIVPKRKGRVIVQGQVTFLATPFNALPSALAPLLLFVPAWFTATENVPAGGVLLYYLVRASIPSTRDLKVALSYPSGVLFWLAVLLSLYLFNDVLPVF